MARYDRNYQWGTVSSSTTLPTTAAALFNLQSQLETDLGLTLHNHTVERIVGNVVLEVPASTSPGRAYTAFLGLAILDIDQITSGAVPDPFEDSINWIWEYGAKVYADHTVPSSYASPAVPHHLSSPVLDIRQRRRARGSNQRLVLVGYQDNGLGATPSINVSLKTLFRLR